MHELSIAQEIIGIVQQHVSLDREPSVQCVKIRVGKLSNILPESLQFCFESLVHGSSLSGAKLEIEQVPVIIHCNTCHSEKAMEQYSFSCLQCGSADITAKGGDELHVASIEMQD